MLWFFCRCLVYNWRKAKRPGQACFLFFVFVCFSVCSQWGVLAVWNLYLLIVHWLRIWYGVRWFMWMCGSVVKAWIGFRGGVSMPPQKWHQFYRIVFVNIINVLCYVCLWFVSLSVRDRSHFLLHLFSSIYLSYTYLGLADCTLVTIDHLTD